METPFPAYAGDEPYVFVCYAHSDSEIIYPEISWLRENGVNIWYDEGVAPGSEFPEELAKAIEGARHMLFYVSPRSAASRHCRDEVYFALERNVSVVASQLEPTEVPPGLALTTGTIQALVRHEMGSDDYRRKLLSVLSVPREVDESLETKPSSLRAVLLRLWKPATALAALVAVLVISKAVVDFLDHREKVRWAKEEALPEIEHMVDTGWRDLTDAYALAMEAKRYIPEDPRLTELLARSSLPIDITTDPPGADVYVKRYAAPESAWSYLGVTPLRSRAVPVGIFRWKVEKEGYEPVMAAAPSWTANLGGRGEVLDPSQHARRELLPASFSRTLDAKGEIPDGMVRVSGANTAIGTLGDFYIDRFEVTNAEFRAFVNAGAYRNPRWWKHEFIDAGRRLSFDEAMARFVDRTGRPGPATWRAGDYIEGTERYPVSGVSWYEADAYATYRGRELPTGRHWGLARGEYSSLIQHPQAGGFVILAPFSNFRRDGPVPVGSLPGITAYGVYDMAGNVREWCWNETSSGRMMRGGAWDDNHYRFAELGQAPPFDRSDKNGFRTVVYLERDKIPAAAFAMVDTSLERVVCAQCGEADTSLQTPVSDEVFETYRKRFAYEKGPLNAIVVGRESSRDWDHERITLDAAYGDERLMIHLFLPQNASPPYQTVIYVPGTGSMFQESSDALSSYWEFDVFVSFLLKSGRAVVYPVYKGTFERRDDALISEIFFEGTSDTYVQWLEQVVKDFRRTIDYLESRGEIDKRKLAYYGMSWGGLMASIIPALEDRIAVNLAVAGGLRPSARGEANHVNYVGRIKVPTLMMNGRYDTIRPIDTVVKPMFDLLGTPAEDKTLRIFETDHVPPVNDLIKEALDWLDRYLGPVVAKDY